MGSGEVGESGRTVNPFSLSEWVRIPPPQLGLKGCYIPPTTAIKIHENGEGCNNEKYNRECILPKGNREDLNGIKDKELRCWLLHTGPAEMRIMISVT